MSLQENDLKKACYDLARNTLWEQSPVNIDVIESLSDKFYNIAISHVESIEALDGDPNLIVRAVNYLECIHAIPPMRDDLSWFSNMLEVLIELASPNSRHNLKSSDFFGDIEKGIDISRCDIK